jgi:hypothetical protein
LNFRAWAEGTPARVAAGRTGVRAKAPFHCAIRVDDALQFGKSDARAATDKQPDDDVAVAFRFDSKYWARTSSRIRRWFFTKFLKAIPGLGG